MLTNPRTKYGGSSTTRKAAGGTQTPNAFVHMVDSEVNIMTRSRTPETPSSGKDPILTPNPLHILTPNPLHIKKEVYSRPDAACTKRCVKALFAQS